MDIEYKYCQPDELLLDYVECFWMISNHSENYKNGLVLPDGNIDLSFSRLPSNHFYINLNGLETKPKQVSVLPGTQTFAVSFKLLATEYIFGKTFYNLLNIKENLETDFWGFNADDLNDFNLCCKKATKKIIELLVRNADPKKRKLFDLIYTSHGSITVKEISEQIDWNSRQINRYFSQQYGISLKAYCTILRFRASFEHIREGYLFPEQDFYDQSHFIREIKKLSGVTPKVLTRNENDRFVQFSLPLEK